MSKFTRLLLSIPVIYHVVFRSSAAKDACVLLNIYDAVSAEAKKNDKDLVELLKPQPGTPRENSGGERSGEDSGRSSRNDNRRGGPPRPFGGFRYPGSARGRGGRYRGSGRGGYVERPLRVRPLLPNGERYPPASQIEVRLMNHNQYLRFN